MSITNEKGRDLLFAAVWGIMVLINLEVSLWLRIALYQKHQTDCHFCVGAVFSFNILFFAPLEIYLGNMNDISVPLKYVLWGIAPLTVAVTAILFFCFTRLRKNIFTRR